jgi:hypothetical protein
MDRLRDIYGDIFLGGFALGIVLATIGLLADIGHLQPVVLTSGHPVIIFAFICATTGAAVACLRFGYELIVQGLAEQAAAREAQARRANPWTAPDEGGWLPENVKQRRR